MCKRDLQSSQIPHLKSMENFLGMKKIIKKCLNNFEELGKKNLREILEQFRKI